MVIASLYADIGAKTENFTAAIKRVKADLTGVKSAFEGSFPGDKLGASFSSYIGKVDGATTAVKNTTEQTKKQKQANLELLPTLENNRRAITDFASANAGLLVTLTAVGIGIKKAYDFGREGAELDYTISKFDRLAESIGSTSDALLSELQSATRGTMSDMELMASATDLVALGLAKSQDEAVRLATVSSGLNMNMNQLVLTLTNMTTMRFDALGVSVDGFKEKVKELEDQGYSANDAFKEAFLQQAEMQLEKVGNAADETIGTFNRFEAALKNAGDTAKMDLAQGLEPVVGYLADVQENSNQVSEALRAVNMDLYYQYSAWRTITPEMQAVADEYARNIEYGRAWEQALQGQNLAMEASLVNFEQMSENNEEFLNVLDSLQSKFESYSEKYAEISADQDLTDEERKSKMAELEAEHTKATNVIILNLLEQKLAQDGLTDAELDMLLRKGQAWGIYSADVVEQARAVIDEANGIAAAINAIPSHKTSIINVITNYSTGTQAAREQYLGGERGIYSAHADGGDFMIPSSYGNEGFRMGNGDTASGGELISITPKGRQKADGVTINIMLDGATIDPETTAWQIGPAVERVLRAKQLI